MNDLIIQNIQELILPQPIDKPLKGHELDKLKVIENGTVVIKDGKITEMIERHQIEGHEVMDVINQLQDLFEKYCEER